MSTLRSRDGLLLCCSSVVLVWLHIRKNKILVWSTKKKKRITKTLLVLVHHNYKWVDSGGENKSCSLFPEASALNT